MRRAAPPPASRARALAESSPSIVTPLNRVIGYEAAAKIAKHAHESGSTLKEAALDLGYVDAATFDRVIDPRVQAFRQARGS